MACHFNRKTLHIGRISKIFYRYLVLAITSMLEQSKITLCESSFLYLKPVLGIYFYQFWRCSYIIP
jgi:hypothetical protein